MCKIAEIKPIFHQYTLRIRLETFYNILFFLLSTNPMNDQNKTLWSVNIRPDVCYLSAPQSFHYGTTTKKQTQCCPLLMYLIKFISLSLTLTCSRLVSLIYHQMCIYLLLKLDPNKCSFSVVRKYPLAVSSLRQKLKLPFKSLNHNIFRNPHRVNLPQVTLSMQRLCKICRNKIQYHPVISVIKH